ncbi:dihydrolipoyl dehydrogenase family protein [Kocuria sp. CPCC 205300]|uniref:dihydrolipoyl dehydrogenase family protein n=1 Tax=Kocuria sabuli TaxID=3071448 RepID=UPI0036DD2F60
MAFDDGVLDLLVIGGGTAGIVGARTAARLGARTVLVERSRTGGDCLWTGCVPSKTILSVARASAVERELTGSGTDFSAVRARIAATIAAIQPDDSAESLRDAGVTVLSGTARFTAPGEAEVDGRRGRFRQTLIATGSAPTVPGIPGLDDARTVTSETVRDLEELPRRLVVVGGGPIGCELGQAFARLGAQVVLVARSGILPKEDRDAAALVHESLVSDGVRVVENAGADRVDAHEDGSSTVHTSDGQAFAADVVLVAAGRTARTEGLGLDAVGVRTDDSGHVVVDARMRTSRPTVWAAGDVTPYPEFTHLAGVHGSTAASNAVLGLRRSVSGTVPRVTYTSPELAAVGVTEASGKGRTTSTIRHGDTDRAVTEQHPDGMTRIVVDRRGRILGGTVVGPRAGESLAELTLAVEQRLSTRDLAGVTRPYPTYNDALWNAAIAHAGSALDSPVAGAAVQALLRLNRWRVRRSTR